MPTLTLVTANLLHGRSVRDGGTREADLRQAAALLDADVLGLQEVDRRQPRSGDVDQAAVMAEEMGAVAWRFVPTVNKSLPLLTFGPHTSPGSGEGKSGAAESTEGDASKAAALTAALKGALKVGRKSQRGSHVDAEGGPAHTHVRDGRTPSDSADPPDSADTPPARGEDDISSGERPEQAADGNELHGPESPADGGNSSTTHGHESAAYGIALLSRLPVLSWHTWSFPGSRVGMPLLVPGAGRPRLAMVADEPRACLAAVLDGPDGPFTVATAHLSFVPGVNARQLRVLARQLQALPAPRYLLGDFNLPGTLPRLLTGWQQLARVPTYPSWAPRVQFDHLLASDAPADLRAESTDVTMPVSDHRALRTVLDRP